MWWTKCVTKIWGWVDGGWGWVSSVWGWAWSGWCGVGVGLGLVNNTYIRSFFGKLYYNYIDTLLYLAPSIFNRFLCSLNPIFGRFMGLYSDRFWKHRTLLLAKNQKRNLKCLVNFENFNFLGVKTPASASFSLNLKKVLMKKIKYSCLKIINESKSFFFFQIKYLGLPYKIVL